jgi:hypothetical protein
VQYLRDLDHHDKCPDKSCYMDMLMFAKKTEGNAHYAIQPTIIHHPNTDCAQLTITLADVQETRTVPHVCVSMSVNQATLHDTSLLA